MIYLSTQLINKVLEMIKYPENEVVEFKEAGTNFNFNDIGKYFSAISNEVNIRGLTEGWLIFGITNSGEVKGSHYREQGSLQALKKEIAANTNERLTFLEIYEIKIERRRVLAFQIPPAIPGIPTTWNGAAYAREDESLCPLPVNKFDLIRNQLGTDWSKQIVEGAAIDDLSQEAIARARILFSKKQRDPNLVEDILNKLTDVEVLNKAGILIKGQITNAALILLVSLSQAIFLTDLYLA